ncbi:hypothetical protein QL285_004005 [Trifolium repens]|nr:hypothetical protein QL285_004005 [Trifolium repens]
MRSMLRAIHIMDTCNGLLLFCNGNGRALNLTHGILYYYVVNYFTKQCVAVLKPSAQTSIMYSYATLIYDPKESWFFKIMRFKGRRSVDVFSSETGEWSTLTLCLPEYIKLACLTKQCVYLNGCVYRLSRSGHLVKIKVDLQENVSKQAEIITLTSDCVFENCQWALSLKGGKLLIATARGVNFMVYELVESVKMGVTSYSWCNITSIEDARLWDFNTYGVLLSYHPYYNVAVYKSRDYLRYYLNIGDNNNIDLKLVPYNEILYDYLSCGSRSPLLECSIPFMCYFEMDLKCILSVERAFDVLNGGCSWLDYGTFPLDLNSTNIALIPKGDNQVSMKDWRPIALCNVLYKVVAKVLANRLKEVLDKCISDNQSAFVPGRSILDNAMATIEIVHFMKSKTREKQGEVALKLDISKAYDRLDWDYLRDIQNIMGFSQKWISWIMLCVETVEYSVILNGSLSALIRKAECRGDIHGIKICRNAPIVSHLLFADDCFLFFQAEENEATIMKEILSTYENASGQSINLQKSEIFYIRNVSEPVKNSITNILGVRQQAWKLFTNPDNLITRLFKVKYYPNSDFLNSSIGHNPSYVWRSIWSAKFVVRNGYKWSIGPGFDIPLWNQKWLSDGSDLQPPFNLDLELLNMTVSDMMVTNGRSWNTPLIRDLFDPSAASKILQTPLIESVNHDNLIWRHEKDGLYSVKSAYSRQLWQEAGWWQIIQPHLLGHTGVAEIVFSVLQVLTADACTILWNLWQQRNNKIWRNHNEPVRVVMDRANNMLSDWSAAQIKRSRQHQLGIGEKHVKPVIDLEPLVKRLVLFDEEMRSVNDFEVEDLKQFLYRKRDGTGFVIFGSILRSERISEVKVLKLILCNRGLSTSFQLFLLSSLIQSQASISGKQVTRSKDQVGD